MPFPLILPIIKTEFSLKKVVHFQHDRERERRSEIESPCLRMINGRRRKSISQRTNRANDREYTNRRTHENEIAFKGAVAVSCAKSSAHAFWGNRGNENDGILVGWYKFSLSLDRTRHIHYSLLGKCGIKHDRASDMLVNYGILKINPAGIQQPLQFKIVCKRRGCATGWVGALLFNRAYT